MCGIAGILDENHHLENQQVIFNDMIQTGSLTSYQINDIQYKA